MLEGNEGILQDRENALLSKVKEDAGDFCREGRFARSQARLGGRIRELEATLAAKKDEMRQLDDELESCLQGIEIAKQKYSDEYSEIDRDKALWLDESVSESSAPNSGSTTQQ